MTQFQQKRRIRDKKLSLMFLSCDLNSLKKRCSQMLRTKNLTKAPWVSRKAAQEIRPFQEAVASTGGVRMLMENFEAQLELVLPGEAYQKDTKREVCTAFQRYQNSMISVQLDEYVNDS